MADQVLILSPAYLSKTKKKIKEPYLILQKDPILLFSSGLAEELGIKSLDDNKVVFTLTSGNLYLALSPDGGVESWKIDEYKLKSFRISNTLLSTFIRKHFKIPFGQKVRLNVNKSLDGLFRIVYHPVIRKEADHG